MDELDVQCAALLGIPVDVYIRKIESLDTFTMLAVLSGLLSEDAEEIADARRLFEETTENF
jgi:hypothetical protein